jgi:two-component system sensor histidine kinase BaeS
MASGSQGKPFRSLFRSHLGLELICSHLLATLGSLFLLTVVVLFATRNYFISALQQQVEAQASYAAKSYEEQYANQGGSWEHFPAAPTDELSLLIITNTNLQILYSRVPAYLVLTPAEADTIQQCMTQALAGHQNSGNLQDSSDPHAFSGYYVCQPLTSQNQMIGAMFFADPQLYPRGFSPNSFLRDISTSVLLTSAGVALVTILLSLFFIRRLTSPLILMKEKVDRFSTGKYTERIPGPFPPDEFGQLALSFNHMARQIEENILALHQQEQYRRELTANIAHDLSTPLSSIRGFSEALDDNVIQEEQARHDTYKLIIRETERLSHLVKDVQQLSSLEAGQISLDLAVVDLVTLVDQTIEVIAPQCEEAQITVQNKLGSSTLPVYADSNRLTQVLLNIFDNARQYTPPGGTITVESTAQRGLAWLRITDTGHGIAPEDLPRIFDRFYRTDPARARQTGGSGLGLAIAQMIIQMHHGTIRAESAPGKGTSIIMALPLSARQ